MVVSIDLLLLLVKGMHDEQQHTQEKKNKKNLHKIDDMRMDQLPISIYLLHLLLL